MKARICDFLVVSLFCSYIQTKPLIHSNVNLEPCRLFSRNAGGDLSVELDGEPETIAIFFSEAGSNPTAAGTIST